MFRNHKYLSSLVVHFVIHIGDIGAINNMCWVHPVVVAFSYKVHMPDIRFLLVHFVGHSESCRVAKVDGSKPAKTADAV